MATTLLIKAKGPDPILVKDQLHMLQWFHREYGVEAFSRFFFWILQKKEDERLVKIQKNLLHSRYVPFDFNNIQCDISRNIAKRNICVKPRQIGLTTWFLIIRCLLPSLINPGTNGFLVSQNNEYARKHFKMLRRAFKYIGVSDPSNWSANDLTISLHENLLHTTASNTKELILDQLDNSVGIGSAETEETGQGVTLHWVVCSEVARWPGKPEETLANLKEAIVYDGTLDLESTPDGAQGYFFEEFQRAMNGTSDFKHHFHEWWMEPTYIIPVTSKQEKEMRADLDADERRLMEKIKLTMQQIAFRRDKQLSLRHNFAEKYPEDPITCFLLSGNSFFDKNIVAARMMELGTFKPYGQSSNGECVIFKKWVKGRQYVIGADPASGKTVTSKDTDFSCAKVLDLETGEECASYQARLSPIDFALDLANLGRQYNNALIAVERGTAADAGGEGGSVIITLIHDCYYTNIYKHKEWLRRDRKARQSVNNNNGQGGASFIELEGMPMNGKTRPIALNRLKHFIENNPELIWDINLVRQCLQFTRDERGRPAGAEGCHDDAVLAAAIAQYCRLVVLGYINPELSKSEKYGRRPQEVQAVEEQEESLVE